ncbi:PREDICTED: anoctamin-4-like [Priapulus caudatus]|uniref:Anoctamin n=1 Tax=Priapulus caudatus TaxID=37621 RepID=A0ABM1EG57_PRICU|nr:PREDICTED: anoctamin-4-like [Priapulus caudatus]
MCPQCDVKCPYWYINETCTYTRFTFLFDNPATVFFAVFMAVWATLFLEFWQRRQHVLAWDWDVQNFDDEETVRPQYEKQATEKKLNPVTQQEQPHIPWSTRFIAKTYSFCSLFFLLVLVMAAVFGVIVYRIIIGTLLYMNEKDAVRNTSSIVTSITASIINLIVIMILGQVYKLLAKLFTDMGRYNYYALLDLYCDPSGCMVELVIQLTTIMIGKQFFNNIKEIVMPKLMKWIKKILKGETEASAPRTSWERDYLVQGDPLLGFFDEYLEMVIQYGFITLFVAAFPLAPLFALLNNIMEIRIDAYKYTVEYRRPLAARAQDIGIWYSILRSITILAVIFNAFVISTTSDFIQRLVYMYGYSDNKNLEGYMNNSLSVFATKDFPANTGPDYSHITINTELRDTEFCRYRGYRFPPGDVKEYQVNLQHWHIFTAQLAFVVVFEHVVFFLAWFIAVIIPNVPQSVKDQMEREKYLAKTVIYKLESERAKKARKGQDSSIPESEARVSGLTNF